MKKIGIFYGSTTGTVAGVARKIADLLGVPAEDVHDMAKSAPSDVAPYDVLILGTSTWGDGDMQEDAHDFADGLQALDLSSKEVALFGCGDESMTDTFCNGVDELKKYVEKTGAVIIGLFNAKGYDFAHSTSVASDGVADGLLLDEVNHSDTADERIKEWVDLLKKEM